MTARPRRPGRPRSADFTTPLTIPGGAVAGADVVRELPPEVALPVWQVLRTVLLWAAEEPAQRSGLFEPCAMAEWERQLLEEAWEPDVRDPLAVLVGEMARLSQAAPETIAKACLCVTDWALEHGHVATALAYAEAAALSWPQHPRYAWTAGRLMRAHGRPREAELWLKRAEKAATTAGDWEARLLALNSLGNTHAEKGNYRQAALAHTNALRIARRKGWREREGELLHDLFVAVAHEGDLDIAESHARAALEIYCSTQHSRLLALAHDIAVLWMERDQFGRALPVFVEIAQHFKENNERMLVVSSAARAAGACCEEELYSQLAQEAATLEAQATSTRFLPRSLYLLGLGAWSLSDWESAERLLVRAEQIALERGENDIVTAAGHAAVAVRERQSARVGHPPVTHTLTGRGTLAGRFVATLRKAPVLVTEGILSRPLAA